MIAPARILFADDSMVVRAVIRGQLVGEEYILIEAADGHEALARARSDAPDVILLDVEMPGKSGYEVLAEIQADESLAHIPVVFLSGRVTAEDVARGLRFGAYDYLRKPVEPGELIARLTAALRTKELHDRLRRDNAHLREIASIDPLTGALDVRGLQRALKDLAAASCAAGEPLGGVLLDIDGLAAVNDRFGWDGGDMVLEEIATRITEQLSPSDVVGRCGPDEFLVLVPNADADAATRFAAELREHVVVEAIVLDGVSHRIGVSVGATAILDGDAAVLLSTLQQSIAVDKTRRHDHDGPPPASAADDRLLSTAVASSPAGEPPVEPAPEFDLEIEPVADESSAPAPPTAPAPAAPAAPAPAAPEPLDRERLMAKLRAASQS